MIYLDIINHIRLACSMFAVLRIKFVCALAFVCFWFYEIIYCIEFLELWIYANFGSIET